MYLDVGSANGNITFAIGNELGLTKNYIHGVDIKEWMCLKNRPNKNITFSYVGLNNEIKYPDKIFNLITIFQTLHHIINLQDILNEIKRICAYGGILILREHDVINQSHKMLVDLEHIVHGINIKPDIELVKFYGSYYGNYRSMDNWDCIFIDLGFKPIDRIYEKNSPTRYCTSLYINTTI